MNEPLSAKKDDETIELLNNDDENFLDSSQKEEQFDQDKDIKQIGQILTKIVSYYTNLGSPLKHLTPQEFLVNVISPSKKLHPSSDIAEIKDHDSIPYLFLIPINHPLLVILSDDGCKPKYSMISIQRTNIHPVVENEVKTDCERILDDLDANYFHFYLCSQVMNACIKLKNLFSYYHNHRSGQNNHNNKHQKSTTTTTKLRGMAKSKTLKDDIDKQD